MKSFIFNFMSGGFGDYIGRRNLVRLGAFILRAGRLDIPNCIERNGEILVQAEVLKNLENKDVVIVDCGASWGQWSTQLATTVRNLTEKQQLKVFCFEPSSYTFDKLTNALNALKSTTIQFTPIKNALSSQAGSIDLKIVHDGAGTNSLVDVPGDYDSVEAVIVTTLDEFAKQNNKSHIDLLKIDVEGHDFDVILGAEKLLNEMKISIIQFEYNWRWIYGKHFLQEAFHFFDERNYCIGKVIPKGIQFYPHYDVQLESFVEGNYIACTKIWKDRFTSVPSWFE